MADPHPNPDVAPPDAPADLYGDDVRARIVAAATRLIAAGGRDAATTRAVAAAAAVQAPAIYRLFGDKRGLLDAVAEHGMAAFVAEKSARAPDPDPVQALRDGWDQYVGFGLAHPGLFAIMSGDPPADRQTQSRSPAATAGLEVLRRRIRAIARAGRLHTSEERAVALVHAAGVGTVLTLLEDPPQRRDPGLSAAAREAIVVAITGDGCAPAEAGPRGTAAALRASLDETSALTPGERHLLDELLARIADGA